MNESQLLAWWLKFKGYSIEAQSLYWNKRAEALAQAKEDWANEQTTQKAG